MPELPEVESYRLVIEDNCLRKKISRVEIPVPYLLRGTTVAGFKKAFEGTSFVRTYRHGKFLFAQNSKKVWMYFHFGLTGDLEFLREVPRFTAVSFHTRSGILCFSDMRKFGHFGLAESPEEFLKQRKWGPDALSISKDDFMRSVRKKGVAIKTVLLDQKIVAGIGNEYSDEILFRSKLHPEVKPLDLTEKKLAEVYQNSMKVLKEAVKANADRSKMKKLFFVLNRKPGNACPGCGGLISSKTVGGRTAYFCPKCQKK